MRDDSGAPQWKYSQPPPPPRRFGSPPAIAERRLGLGSSLESAGPVIGQGQQLPRRHGMHRRPWQRSHRLKIRSRRRGGSWSSSTYERSRGSIKTYSKAGQDTKIRTHCNVCIPNIIRGGHHLETIIPPEAGLLPKFTNNIEGFFELKERGRLVGTSAELNTYIGKMVCALVCSLHSSIRVIFESIGTNMVSLRLEPAVGLQPHFFAVSQR
jgi:hypothetical protein